MTRWRQLGMGCAALCCWAGAQAATLVMQPGDSLREVLRRAADGDTVHIVAGDHYGQVAVVLHKRLTLLGVASRSGSRPVLHADGQHAEGKAILVVRHGDIRIENIEFRGTRVPGGNGAGIRFERGRLAVVNCVFIDNQNGILAGNDGGAELRVEKSTFGAAPEGTSLPHLLYVGRIASFFLGGSHFSGGRSAHLVKSRALKNHVQDNRLADGVDGSAAYELEFPEGGLAWVVGNVIAQSANTTNPAIVSFGAEGLVDQREQGLFMAHNTLVNQGSRPAVFVRIHPPQASIETRFVNNLSVGIGDVGPRELVDPGQGNFNLPMEALPGADSGRYALSPGSGLRGRGVPPGSARGVSLRVDRSAAARAAQAGTSAQPRWSPGAEQP